MTATAVADPTARGFLRNADPVLAPVIDAHPDFRPRAWIDELPGLDAFGMLIFQVTGQQLSVRATRTILSRLEEHFEGHWRDRDRRHRRCHRQRRLSCHWHPRPRSADHTR
jgi:3-methyladenine DNA glycosylase/8-oxoguanine DNA glycosylase